MGNRQWALDIRQPGDEFIAEGESWHQAALLQPEDRGKRAGEEDSLIFNN